MQRAEGRRRHLGKGGFTIRFRLLLAIDLVVEVAVAEKTDIPEPDVAETLIKVVERRAVLRDKLALILGECEEVNLVISAGIRVGLGLEVTASTTKQDVDGLIQRVTATDLLLSNGGEAIAIDHMR